MSGDMPHLLAVFAPVVLVAIVVVVRLIIYGHDPKNVRFGLRLMIVTGLIATAFLLFAPHR